MPTDKDIFEANVNREQTHSGETQICIQCGGSGIVGQGLEAMANAFGNVLSFGWIHDDKCKEERMAGTVIIDLNQ